MDFSTIHMQKSIFTWMFVYIPKCTKSIRCPRISELPEIQFEFFFLARIRLVWPLETVVRRALVTLCLVLKG